MRTYVWIASLFWFPFCNASSQKIEIQGSLFAKEGVVIISPSLIHEGSLCASGGTVALVANGELILSGTIDVSSQSSKGGNVKLQGEQIELIGARIAAWGFDGGGNVFIGNQIPLASVVFMDYESTILANAVERGDGGVVVLLSEDLTVFNGVVFVRGGSLEGSAAGVVQVASFGQLSARLGRVDDCPPQNRWE